MRFGECVVKSQLYPFVLNITGGVEDIGRFKAIVEDSSDMAGYCFSFSEIAETAQLDPINYKVDEKNIFEWRSESIALADRVSALEHHRDHVVNDNRVLTLQLVRALNAKPPYKDLLDLVADLEGYLMAITRRNGAPDEAN